jgi:hypothetical protein
LIASLLAAALAAPAGVQTPPVVEACAVVAAPRDYVGRKFTIRTKLALGRHASLLNFPSQCRGISYKTLEDSPARQALGQISEVMIGIDYWRRFKARAPQTRLELDLEVTATGTMFCPTASSSCVMQVTDLDDVLYPAKFPQVMVPPGSRWAGP